VENLMEEEEAHVGGNDLRNERNGREVQLTLLSA